MSKHNWATPQYFFDELNKEFGFTVDVCADSNNAKMHPFFSPLDDGLSQPWHGVCWMNPPYDTTMYKWVEKAYLSAQLGSTVVCLLPGRSNDTRWWHAFVMRSSEIRFIADRIHFGQDGVFTRANISSVVVVFRPYCIGTPLTMAIDNHGRNLTPRVPDSLKAGVMSLPESVLVENALPAVSG